MNALKRTWIWLCRIRHRKGYGVHSPFAFQFIQTVLNEAGQYYAYHDLKPLRAQYAHRVSSQLDRLLFRLANHAQPRLVWMIGATNDLSCRYVQAGCGKAQVVCMPDAQQAISHLQSSDWQQPIDLLVLGSDALHPQLFQAVLPHLTEHSVVVAEGVYDSHSHQALWQTWVQDKAVVLAFDLYECGVMLFNPHYQKQTFKVNFIAV